MYNILIDLKKLIYQSSLISNKIKKYVMNTTNLNQFNFHFYMVEEQTDYEGQISWEMNTKIRDLEERYRMLRDRLLLLGQNLIEIKEKTSGDIFEMKKDLEIIKRNIERLISFFETASAEFSKFARKEDLEILSKQAKMFQPLEFVRKKDLKKLKN